MKNSATTLSGFLDLYNKPIPISNTPMVVNAHPNIPFSFKKEVSNSRIITPDIISIKFTIIFFTLITSFSIYN